MITTVREGKAIGVRGNPDHPFTRGGLCVKVNDYQNRVYSADRVLFPLARTGREGSGQFERITWDEALSAIKTRWTSIIDQHGPAAILPYSSLGNEGVLNGLNVGDASFNTLGAAISERTFCDSGAITAFFMSCGPTAAIGPESFVHSRSIILWRSTPSATICTTGRSLLQRKSEAHAMLTGDPLHTRSAFLLGAPNATLGPCRRRRIAPARHRPFGSLP